MLKLENIFVYRNPTYPDMITVVMQGKSNKGEKIKRYRLPESQANKLSNKSYELLLNEQWTCYPYIFECGGIGYMLSRR